VRMPAMPLPITTSLRFCMFKMFMGRAPEGWNGRLRGHQEVGI
jgi:hypothetical protein